MQTKYGGIDKLFPKLEALTHNLITNEISGIVYYYLSQEVANSGQYSPIHQQQVSWIVDADNSLIMQEAVDRIAG